MTLDEFLALPETEPATELIDGYPCQKPVGKKPHSRATWRLGRLLDRHPATAGGSVYPELGFRFARTTPGNLRVPDLSYYLPGHDDDDSDYPERAPDLAVEVRSEGQLVRVLEERLAFLREQGTACTLLVDPEAQSVHVHEGDRSWTASGDDTVTLASLAGFSFTVRDLWQ